MSPIPKPTRRGPRKPRPIARKARVRKVSASPAAVARRKDDREWAEIIKQRAKGLCERCGTERGTDAHHVISRRYKDSRTVPANGVYLSRACHNWAHRHPREFRMWFALTFPGRERVLVYRVWGDV